MINSGGNEEDKAISVIGMGCRFPGGVNNPGDFWEMLINRREGIGPVPRDRWDSSALYHPDHNRRGKISVKWGGFLKEIDRFDPRFFGISPKEAQRMDPQQRLLLEETYHALEDAGLSLEDLKGREVGVFIGISSHDYGDIGLSPTEHPFITGHTISGGSLSIAANRISYVFDFRGPSMAIDTACSSSLIALHSACSALGRGECSLAVVGGVNLLIKPEVSMSFNKGGFLSPEGRCYAFDHRARGYVRSEGVGMVILKSRKTAEADGNRIYGLIRGTASNQDGHTDGMSKPGLEAQVEVLKRACRQGGVDPGSIQYVEAHGTGTAVGDPIEAGSIGRVFGAARQTPVIIGSVKTNIGHLEPASGMAGLIKLLLALKHKTIPPNANFQTPNQSIDFKGLNIRVADQPLEWSGSPRIGAVNSFGFGGANAHVIVEEYISGKKKESMASGPEIFALSADSEEGLNRLTDRYINFLKEGKENFTDICYSTRTRRTPGEFRLGAVAFSREELTARLEGFKRKENHRSLVSRRPLFRDRNAWSSLFIYSGQGPQWYAMGRDLLEQNEVFRSTIEEIDSYLKEWDWLPGSSLIQELMKEEAVSRINETGIAQPAIFALQVGLTRWWAEKGITPQGVIGHSVGEVAASWACGALSLKEASRVIYHRSRHQNAAAGKGRMLALGLSEAEARTILSPWEAVVSLAVMNGPRMVTLSGEEQALKEIEALAEKRKVFSRFLRVDIPFHSHYLEVIREPFIQGLGEVERQSTQLPFYSSLAGGLAEGEALDGEYWYGNIRHPVRFYRALLESLRAGYSLFLEISPHPILSSNVRETLDERHHKGVVLSSLKRKDDDFFSLRGALCTLFCAGYPLDWEVAANPGNYVDLPLYPFKEERYWTESRESGRKRLQGGGHPHIKKYIPSARSSNDHTWLISLDSRLNPYIKDHRVQGPVIFPGAGSCDLAITCARAAYGKEFSYAEDIRFEKALFLPDEEEPPEIQFNLQGDEGIFGIYSRKEGEWTRHVSGKLLHCGEKFHLKPRSLSLLKEGINREVDMDRLYRELFTGGLQLGDSFRGVKTCFRREGRGEYPGEGWGIIEAPDAIAGETGAFSIHPALLDACFQTLFGSVPLEEGETPGVCIPVRIGKLKYYKKPGNILTAYGCLKEITGETISGDLRIFDNDEQLCVELEDFTCRFLEEKEARGRLDQYIYHFEWLPSEREGEEAWRCPGDYLPLPGELDFRNLVKQLRNREEYAFYNRAFSLVLNQLTLEYVIRAYRELGYHFPEKESFTSEELADRLKITGTYIRKLFFHTIKILEEGGYLELEGGRWQVVRPLHETPAPIDREELKSGGEHLPFAHELRMLDQCGPFLKAIFRGEMNPVELLFGGESFEETTAFYRESYSFKKYNELMARALKQILEKLPRDRGLRVLEIGAGTGGMTAALLPLFPPLRTHYTFTDCTPIFLEEGRKEFASYPFVEYKLLDIEDPGREWISGAYDIVIASDVIHATRSLSRSLEKAAWFLAPGGLFLMLEVTRSPWWTDLVFGLTEGWWVFEDYDLRKDYPLLEEEQWKRLLEAAGFQDIRGITEADEQADNAQMIFIARRKEYNLQVPSFPAPLPGSWLIFADETGLGAGLISFFKQREEAFSVVKRGGQFSATEEVIEINPEEERDMRLLLEIIPPPRGIVYLWNLDLPDPGILDETNIDALYARGVTALIPLVNGIEEHYSANPPFLKIFTRGAVAEVKNPLQASVWGFVRSLLHELTHIPVTLVDLDGEVEEDLILREILAPPGSEEVRLKGKRRFTHHMLKGEGLLQEEARLKNPGKDGFKLEIKEKGVFDSLVFRQTDRKRPGAGEVEVNIHAGGLNFKDIMLSLGMLDPDAPEGGYTGFSLGMEGAGIITALGEGVQDLRVGDRVFVTAPGCLGSFVTLDARFALPFPDYFTMEEGAALPVAYLTAYYSLVWLGRLEAGEKVLIHSASGGVGLAAVNIARCLGAEVYATAGSEEKQSFLKKIGIKHVLNSRSLDFGEEILSRGKKMDIVLNSLSGQGIYRSLTLLGKYGRFIEIGKRDIYENNPMYLRPFWNNLSYFAVDIDKLMEEKRDFCRRLYLEIGEFLRKHRGRLVKHPVTLFDQFHVRDAFRNLSKGLHIGKVIVKIKDKPTPVEPSEDFSFLLESGGAYLITGGFSGFGLYCARWLADNGARNLVLAGRSGAKEEAAAGEIAGLKERGVRIKEALVDITREEQVRNLMEELKRSFPPLRGVIHSAMVLDDAILQDMNHQRFMKAVKPKVLGAWFLHKYTENLDFFLSFSSMSGLYGIPAQSNYAAANAFLDALADYRKNKGLKSTTLAWGAIGHVGFVARNKETGDILKSQGWRKVDPLLCLRYMERSLLEGRHRGCLLDADWDQVGQYFPADKKSSRLGYLFQTGGKDLEEEGVSLVSLLKGQGGEELLMEELTSAFARIIGASPGEVDTSMPINKMGLDSLMANQLRNWIQLKLEQEYSMMKIMKGPTLRELASHLMEGMKAGEKDEPRGGEVKLIKEHCSLRLFCLPYMGGNGSSFFSWDEYLGEEIELHALDYPGLKDPGTTFDSLDHLIGELGKQMLPWLDKPFALYGHSMGAGVAFQLILHLKKEYNKEPVHFFPGAWPAPWQESPFALYRTLEKEQLYREEAIPLIKDHLRFLEVDERLLQNEELFGKKLPAIRKEILMGISLSRSTLQQLSCPVSALGGEDDSVFSREQITGWAKQTTGPFEARFFSGKHIFIWERKAEVTAFLKEKLR